jgi:hypothetical protein
MRVGLLVSSVAVLLSPRVGTAATCTPGAITTAPTTEFVAFASLERLEVRGGRLGAADWEWGLGVNTQQSGSFVSQSLDWISGRPFTWDLTYAADGSATITVRDGAEQRFSRTFTPSAAPGMRSGNALRLYVKASADSGAARVAATLSEINGAPANVSISTLGDSTFSDQTTVVAHAATATPFRAVGTVTLTFSGSAPPTGSRLNFIVTAGNVPCDGGGGPLPAPRVVNPTPPNGASIPADALPLIGVGFEDAGGGIAASSARLVIDGTDVTSSATVTATGISFRPLAALPEGAHSATAAVTNLSGQSTSLTWGFSTASAPQIEGVTPEAVATTRRRSTIRASFSDVGAGVDPARVVLLVDGVDVTAQATVSSAQIEYTPANDMALGERAVSLRIVDHAGNATTKPWTFSVIEVPPPTTLSGTRGAVELPVVAVPVP